MFSLDFLNRQFFIDELLAPLAVLVLGMLIGGAVNHRMKALLQSGRFAEKSFVCVLLRSLNNLPRFFGVMLGLYMAVNVARIPDSLEDAAEKLIFALFIWMAATFLQRSLCQIIEMRMGKDGSPASTSLLLDLVSAVVYILGIIFVLDAYGVSITPIVTALGIGGMAVALGLQETMASIFAGLHILVTKQVRIGDHIRLDGGAEGQIIDITWRYAKIHTITNNVIIVPNNKLAASIITNYDMAAEGGAAASVEDVAFSVGVGVAYDSDLEAVENVTLETAREVLARLDPEADTKPGSPMAPAVRFQTFGESSIDFNVNMHTTSFSKQYLIRHEFIKALKKRFEEEGIVIPFPIRTVVQK